MILMADIIESYVYQGGGYEEVRSWLKGYPVWVSGDGRWGLDNGFEKDERGISRGEPAVVTGDILLKNALGEIVAVRLVTFTAIVAPVLQAHWLGIQKGQDSAYIGHYDQYDSGSLMFKQIDPYEEFPNERPERRIGTGC